MIGRRLFAAAAIFVCSAASAHALDITTCGQIIPSGETGVLVSDLNCPTATLGCFECTPNSCFPTGAPCTISADCTGPGDLTCTILPGVAIDRSGTLDMNGHSITGTNLTAVDCRRRGPCTITSTTGRGNITGVSVGVMMGSGRLRVSHVDVHDNSHAGFFSTPFAARMELTDVTANNNAGSGIRAASITANGVTANGNSLHGIETRGKVAGSNVTTNDNGLSGSVAYKGAKITNFTATGNGNSATPDLPGGGGLVVGSGSTFLTNATITGNTYEVGEGGPVLLDLITVRKPKFTGTCDHSASIVRKTGEIGAPWGVCTGD